MEVKSWHKCTLPKPEHIADEKTPPGPFHALRLWFRKLTMSSGGNPLAKVYFKSYRALQNDRINHYDNYFWSIHPLSNMCCFMEFYYLVIFLLALALCPLVVIWQTTAFTIWKNILDLFFIIHIGISFYTGHIKEETKEIVLDKRRISKKYLKGHFFLELATSLPYNILFHWPNRKYGWLVIFHFMKILRIYYVIKILRNIKMRFNLSNASHIVIIIILIYFIFSYWFSGMLMFIEMFSTSAGQIQKNDDTSGYLIDSISKVASLLFASGDADLGETTMLFVIFEIICITIKFIVRVIIFALILEIVMNYDKSRSRYKYLINQLKKFCEIQRLPGHFEKRLKNYYSFRFNDKIVNEKKLLNILPPNLTKQINLSCYQKYIDLVDMFKGLPLDIRSQLALALTQEIYLTNDVIVERENTAHLFIVAFGTVAVYTSNGKEISHLEDNSYFGELNLILPTDIRTANAVAISCCEILILKNEDFKAIMSNHVVHMRQLQDYAEGYLEKAMLFMQNEKIDVIVPKVVIDEYGLNEMLE